MLKMDLLPRRILIAGGLIVLLLLIFAFSKRIADFTRLSNLLAREGARITELVATQSYLQDQITYATSEAAVEQWAREDGRLAKPGDFAVVPLPLAGSAPLVLEAARPTQQALSNWQAWMEWFFYDGP